MSDEDGYGEHGEGLIECIRREKEVDMEKEREASNCRR